MRFHAILWCDSNNMGSLCLTVLLVVYPEDLQLTCLWAAAQARGVRPVLSTAFTSVPTMIKFKNILNTPVTKKQRIVEPLYADILSLHVFHQRIILPGNATSELEQPQWHLQKWENKKRNWFKEQSKNSECAHPHSPFLLSFACKSTLQSLERFKVTFYSKRQMSDSS